MNMSMSAASGVYPRADRYINQSHASSEACQHGSRRCDSESRAPRSSGDGGPGRPNPLVRAMMQALQGLMSGSASGTQGPSAAGTGNTSGAADTAATGSTAVTTASPTVLADVAGLKSAAMEFAHELYSALRGTGRDGAPDAPGAEAGEGRSGRGDYNHHHHRHHAGHHGRAGRDGYSDLAQDLRRLAQSLGEPAPASAPPAAAPASTAPANAIPGTPATPTTAADTAPEVLDAPAPASSAAVSGISIEIKISVRIQLPASAAPVASAPALPAPSDDEEAGQDDALTPAQDTPLLAAFKRLMDKLAPFAASGGVGADSATGSPSGSNGAGNSNGADNSATAGTGTATASPLEKLRAFLLGMADALSRDNSAPFGRPATGGLLSVAA